MLRAVRSAAQVGAEPMERTPREAAGPRPFFTSISRLIEKLDAEREKKRTRIEVVLPVEVVRRSEE